MPLRRALAAASLPLFGAALAACSPADIGTPGTAETDRQAETVGIAISYPRQQDAAGLARALLALNDHMVVLDATDLPHDSNDDPAARLVIRIHVDEQAGGGLTRSTPAYDACYRLSFMMPSSSMLGHPDRIGCPPAAEPLTPPPAPSVPHLPAHADARLARVVHSLPAHPTEAEATAALTAAFPPPAYVSAEVVGNRVAVAAGVSRGISEAPDCAIALRTGTRVEPVHPQRITLMPGEAGCVADQAIRPVITH